MQDEFNSVIKVDGFVSTGGERRPATLELTDIGIGAQGHPESIAWRSAKIRRDDADGALLVVGKKLTAGSTDPTFLRAMEGLAGNTLDHEIAKLRGDTTGWRGSQTVGCMLFFGLLMWGLLSAPGCYRSGVNKTVDSLDPSIDKDLGEAAIDSMGDFELIEDPVVTEAIEEIVARLKQHMGDEGLDATAIDWQVRVVRDETNNAYALPGGFITVYTGLIESSESADMVASILAHEMAHVTQRHGLRQVANKIGLFAGVSLLFGDLGGLVGVAGDVLNFAAGRDYQQDLELEADHIGTETMVRAGLRAEALGEFFETLKNSGTEIPIGLRWMSTHPGHDTRMDAIDAIIEGMDVPEPRPLEIDWQAVLDSVGKSD